MQKNSFKILVLLIVFISSSKNYAQAEKKYLGLGFSDKLLQETDSRDVKIALKLWLEELNRLAGFNYNPNVLIFDNVEVIMRAISTQEIGMVALHSLDYFALRDQVALEPFFVPNFSGSALEEYVLLVRKDQGFRELTDLRDKQLLIPSGNLGLIHTMWLDVLLMNGGLPQKEKFFHNIKAVNKEFQSVLPVFFKQADCCVVNLNDFNTMMTLNPQLGEALMPIARSAPYLKSMFCFTKNIDETEKKNIREVALNIDSYARGRQILTLFRFDGIFPFKSDYLENIESLFFEHTKIKVANR